jgi:hypothetical protein
MKKELRALLISAKMLQVFADIFAVFGIFLFAYIYFTHWRDSPFKALQDPFFIVTILFPFIPAALLAYLASRKRKQVRSLLEENQKGS